MLRKFGGIPTKSIQYGSISITGVNASATATITSVTTGNALLILLGTSSAGADSASGRASIVLTNATTVTATRNTPSVSGTTVVNFMVIEFNAGLVKSKQSGTITMSNVQSSNTGTITAVNKDKSILAVCGCKYSGGPGDNEIYSSFNITLTNGTTITVTRGGYHDGFENTMIVGWNLVEFN